jgi:hypothetical protein
MKKLFRFPLPAANRLLAHCLLPPAHCLLPPALRLAIFLTAAALLLGSGCRKEDDDCFDEGNPRCSNYDPCWDRKEAVSAGFEVGRFFPLASNSSFPFDYLPMGDTVFAFSNIKFIATDSTAETYEWSVGTDSRTWYEREFNLIFQCDVLHSTLPVRLITTRLRDTSCTEGRFLVDTMTKQLFFAHLGEAVFYGTYKGRLNKYIDEEYEVTIRTDCGACSCSDMRLFIDNLTNENCVRSGTQFIHSFKEGYALFVALPFGTDDACGILLGEGFEREYVKDIYISLSGTSNRDIKITFTYVASSYSPDDPRVEEELEFAGTRID